MRYNIHFEVVEGAYSAETLTPESVIIDKILVGGVYKKKVKIKDRIYELDQETTYTELDKLFEKEIAGYSVFDIEERIIRDEEKLT